MTWLAAAACLAAGGRKADKPEIVEVKMIWGRAPHNAFTDLIRFKDRWYCAFREGQSHVSGDGAIRVLTSADGEVWMPAALITSPTADLRDPKLSVTPDRRLMLIAGAAMHAPAGSHHQTLAWHSWDGRAWGEPAPIGEPDFWMWRVTWRLDRAYGVGYRTSGPKLTRLYTSADGVRFGGFVDRLFDRGDPNEASLLFLADNTALCLLRRDGAQPTAQLGMAKPPYRGWQWVDLGMSVGGPNLIELPEGRIVAAGRLSDGAVRTSLCWLDREQGKLTEFLALPSGGDTSYPGLAWHDDLLWVSYYSSHEEKAMIYLAKVKIPAPKKNKVDLTKFGVGK